MQDSHLQQTSWKKLVEKSPTSMGSHDMAQYGMSGVWFANNTTYRPTLWRHAFPSEITTSLVTYESTQGKISNCDLELADIVTHSNILAKLANIDRTTVATVYHVARNEFSKSLCLAKGVTTTRVIPMTAAKAEAGWLIWLAKFTEWKVSTIQVPSITHPANFLVVFDNVVCTRKITLRGNLC